MVNLSETTNLAVKKAYDGENKRERITVSLANSIVAETYKYLEYAKIFWGVDTGKTKEGYIKALAEFYTELERGGFKEIRSSASANIMMRWGGGSSSFPLETLLCNQERLLKDPNFGESKNITITTAYATFGMESFTGPWYPATGQLFVTSRQPLTKPIAKLVSNTARVLVPTTELEPVLDEIYKF